MAIGFSFLSVNYYIDGLDRGINSTMFDLAKTTNVEDGQPQTIANFGIAKRWQDTPKIIQQRFKSPPTKEGELQKIKDQSNIFALPKNVFFVVLYKTSQGEPIYISKVFLEKDISLKVKKSKPKNRLVWALIVAIIAISLFAFFLRMIMQKIAKPVESLKDWAKSLDQKTVQNSPPDFNYNELNVLASLIQSSLISVHQSLEREQRFLSYASHELRTPIAVVRSSVDLLQRLNEKQPVTEKQQQTLERIQRASLTMSNLTDTFLWLSRNDDLAIAPELVKIDEVIHQACNDLSYLLAAKDVEIKIECQAASVNVVALACHIVLNNLIRNAYQHTQKGYVHINQQGSRVTITNSNAKDDAVKQLPSTNHTSNTNPPSSAFGYGYGLGLELSEKIIEHHNWFYEKSDSQGCYQVIVDFGSEKSNPTD